MYRQRSKVLANAPVAPGHYVLRLEAPKIAKASKPGQFVQLTCGDSCDPLLPRPFSFLDTDPQTISILYHVVGQGTKLLSQLKKGDMIWVLGPLGKGFTLKHAGQRLLVGGGVGIPPLYHLAKVLKGKKTEVFLGARNKNLLLCEGGFKKIKTGLHLSTDDGSKGSKGFVTQSLEKYIQNVPTQSHSSLLIQTCGPTPMLKAVSQLAAKYRIACEVSVEVPMACGFGACLGCAIKLKDRYAIACVEGPVFKGETIQW